VAGSDFLFAFSPWRGSRFIIFSACSAAEPAEMSLSNRKLSPSVAMSGDWWRLASTFHSPAHLSSEWLLLLQLADWLMNFGLMKDEPWIIYDIESKRF